MTNIEKYNARFTQEQIVENAHKANAARRANAEIRRNEKRLLSLRDYTEAYLQEHGEEIVGGIGNIARQSASEQNRIKAVALLVQISQIKPEDNRTGSDLDLKSMSDAELERLLYSEEQVEVPEDYVVIDE